MNKKWSMFFILGVSAIILTACQLHTKDQEIIDSMTSEFAGKRCVTPPQNSGIVTGFFSGFKQTPFQNRGSGIMPVSRYRCFETVETCESWLKTMTYLYNIKGIQKSVCKKH